MSADTNKPWYRKWWGILILIAFFPFTLSYLTWKQKWSIPLRLGIIALIWIVFIGTGSSKSKNNDTANTTNNSQIAVDQTSKPSQINHKIEYTLEQKQTDFKNFYVDFYSQAQRVTTTQKKVLEVANLIDNREELYLAYNELNKQQQNLTDKTSDLEVPASLKEYSQIREALVSLMLSSNQFGTAISKFQDYLNKGDLKVLAQVKSESDAGVASLNDSITKMNEVAKQLDVDVSDPTKITVATGTKELQAGQKVPFELVESTATLTNVNGHNRTVVIDVKYVNENDLNTLGTELKEYSQDDGVAWIQVFSDKRAATEVRVKAQNEDPTLSKSDLDLYDKSFVGQYVKSIGVHSFTYCLSGYYLYDCNDKDQKRVIKY